MASRATQRSLSLAALSTGFVLLWLFVAAFPFIWTAWGSFKVEGDFFSRTDWMSPIPSPSIAASSTAKLLNRLRQSWKPSMVATVSRIRKRRTERSSAEEAGIGGNSACWALTIRLTGLKQGSRGVTAWARRTIRVRVRRGAGWGTGARDGHDIIIETAGRAPRFTLPRFTVPRFAPGGRQ